MSLPPRRSTKVAWPIQVSDGAGEAMSARSGARVGVHEARVVVLDAAAGERVGDAPARSMSAGPRAGWVARSSKRPTRQPDGGRAARARRHALGDPAVAADDRAAADHRVAAEDGGVGVDDDVVLDRRVALGGGELARLARRQRQRAERHALVDAHALADDRGLADDHAGAVIDEEAFADGGRRDGCRCRSRSAPARSSCAARSPRRARYSLCAMR